MLKRCHPIARLGWFLPVLLLGMLLCHPVLSPATLGAGLLCQGMALGAKSCRTTLGFGLPVILLMGGLNLFFNNRGNTVFLYLNDLPLTLESLLYGLSAGCMAVGMAVWLMLLANSLGRSGLLDLFGGLLPGITMILTMLLRFLPLYRRRMKSRMDTQRTLGRTTQEGSLTRRFQDGGRLLSSQFSASLEQSITTADSMTARGYGLGKRPSRWPMEKFRCRDGAALAVTLLLTAGTAAAWLAGGLDCRFFPRVGVGSGLADWGGMVCYLLLLLFPAAWWAGEKIGRHFAVRRWKDSWKEENAHDLLSL